MGIERSKRRVAESRITMMVGGLLDASTLCAIATADRNGRAHINSAYFAWTPNLELVWLSAPQAKHSRNIRANGSTAIAVYDSTQTWGLRDRGIQLFGRTREMERLAADRFEAVYAARFAEYKGSETSAYRFYVMRPLRLKLFDEEALGEGVFVTARVTRVGRTVWERTDIYRPAD